jgi:hypothetical protein
MTKEKNLILIFIPLTSTRQPSLYRERKMTFTENQYAISVSFIVSPSSLLLFFQWLNLKTHHTDLLRHALYNGWLQKSATLCDSGCRGRV